MTRLSRAFREFFTILRTGKPTFDETQAAYRVTVGGNTAFDTMRQTAGAVR